MEAIAKFDFMASKEEDELSFHAGDVLKVGDMGPRRATASLGYYQFCRGVNLTVELLKLFLKKHKQFFQNLKFTSTKVSSEHPCTSHQAGWWKSDWYKPLSLSWDARGLEEIHPCAGLLIDVLILGAQEHRYGTSDPTLKDGVVGRGGNGIGVRKAVKVSQAFG